MVEGQASDPEGAKLLARFRETTSTEWLACEAMIAIREWSGAGRDAVPLDRLFQRLWPVFDAFPSMSPTAFLANLESCGLAAFDFGKNLDRGDPQAVQDALTDALVLWRQGEKGSATVRDTGHIQALKRAIGFSLTRTRDANVPGADIYVSNLPEAVNANPTDVAVLMPFKGNRRVVFEKALRPACGALGLSCMRADEFYGSKHIVSEIFSLIKTAKLVVSDISGLNANVLYETGIAHAIGRQVLLIAEHGTKVPFDILHLRRIEYRKSGDGLKRLAAALQSAFSEMGAIP